MAAKLPGRCVFCGGARLSKGHVWPEWLSAVLRDTGAYHEDRIGDFITFRSTIPGPTPARKVRNGPARSRKPRNTCVVCNGGWMSQIEQRSKSVASGLIGGNEMRIDEEAQRDLAALFCLITMRVEFLSTMRSIAQFDRDFLRTRQYPPANWRIWIARYAADASQYADLWCQHYAAQAFVHRVGEQVRLPSSVGELNCNFQVTTMVLGSLLVHVFSRQADGIEYEGVETPPLTRIWPTTPFGIRSDALPEVPSSQVPWIHEALARTSRPPPAGP